MSKVLVIDSILTPDMMACAISRNYIDWEQARNVKMEQWKEVQQYIYATSTRDTSNGKLPWSNSTVTPKLCQIRDNLHANYMSTLFPRRKWLLWEGDNEEDESLSKTKAITSYMAWVLGRPEFRDEASRIVLDWIDFGNAFVMPEWYDGRGEINEKTGELKSGYAGPIARRISPLDIVFNPTAPTFLESPKIIRSFISIGELKQMLTRSTLTEEERMEAMELWDYLMKVRSSIKDHRGGLQVRDNIYQISGFDSFQRYLEGDVVEILTFYGDLYDPENDTLYKNYVIKVVDRHKIVSKHENNSFFGHAPIYHMGWRLRPDNLWAMGPLDNLVGMQYRIDHLENLKADVFDLLAYPVFKIKGQVEDFEWGPMARIYTGDDGDVNIVSPPVEALRADNQIAILEAKMEEMAGSPKEAMGFRTPGEKTKYEVQRLENAASRIFYNKTQHIESGLFEPLYNAMLALARQMLDRVTIRFMNEELKTPTFMSLTRDDITGSGRIRPVAARHFAEQAQLLQDITQFLGSGAGSDPEVKIHFSALRMAKMYEQLIGLEDYKIVNPYVRLAEQTDAKRMMAAAEEQMSSEIMTPAGIDPNDFDETAELAAGVDVPPE